MFCGRGCSCGRFTRGGRLSLHSAGAGKTNYKQESTESFSHGGEGKQTAELQSTDFQRASDFLRKEQQTTATSPTDSATDRGVFTESGISRLPRRGRLTPKAFTS